MNERYEIFPEWNAGQKQYRIYDKQTDSLLGPFSTLDEATSAFTCLGQAPRGGSDDGSHAAAAASRASVGHEHPQ
jgi:hypothetical protein